MKNKIIITVLTLLISVTGANAEMCTTTTTSTPEKHIPTQAQPFLQYCSSISYKNYYNNSGSAVFSVPECTSCQRGYSKFTFENDGHTDTDWTTSCEENHPTFTICAKPCDKNCVPDEYFDYDRDGVESLIDRQCDYGDTICKYETYYQCASGYYGEAQSDFTGCTQCPYPNNDSHNTAATIPGEATSITDCYIPVNNSNNYFNDGTGTYKCTADAYYKQ